MSSQIEELKSEVNLKDRTLEESEGQIKKL